MQRKIWVALPLPVLAPLMSGQGCLAFRPINSGVAPVAAASTGSIPEACSGTDAAPLTGTVTVQVQDFDFNPPCITVKAGTAVAWVNAGRAQHSVESGFPSLPGAGTVFDADIAPGGTFDFTFTTPATLAYFDRIFPQQMNDGRIIVVP